MRRSLVAIAVVVSTASPAYALEAQLGTVSLKERWLSPVAAPAAERRAAEPAKSPWLAAGLAAVPLVTGLGAAAIDFNLAAHTVAPLPVPDLAIAPSTLIGVRNGLRLVTVPTGGLGHFYAGGWVPGTLATVGLPVSVMAGMAIGLLGDLLTYGSSRPYGVGYSYLGGVLAGTIYQGLMVRHAYGLAEAQP